MRELNETRWIVSEWKVWLYWYIEVISHTGECIECIWNEGQNKTLIHAIRRIHAMSPSLVPITKFQGCLNNHFSEGWPEHMFNVLELPRYLLNIIWTDPLFWYEVINDTLQRITIIITLYHISLECLLDNNRILCVINSIGYFILFIKFYTKCLYDNAARMK